MHFSVDVLVCVLTYSTTFGTLCTLYQDMKERHEKETALKAERDVLAKDAANKQAADLVRFCDFYDPRPVASACLTAVRLVIAHGAAHQSACTRCLMLQSMLATANALNSFHSAYAAVSFTGLPDHPYSHLAVKSAIASA